MDLGVAPFQRGRAPRQPSEILTPFREGFPGRSRSIRQPPNQYEADDDGDQAVEQEHPLEADQAAVAVHLLEAGGHEPDDRGGDLRRGEVLPDALAGARGRVEEGEVVGHAGPHACDDDAEEEAEEAAIISNSIPGLKERKRREETYYKLHAAFMAAMQLPMSPTLMTMRLIHTCGLSRVMIRFDGRSKTT